jgi:hypothetical protein
MGRAGVPYWPATIDMLVADIESDPRLDHDLVTMLETMKWIEDKNAMAVFKG